MSKSAPVRALTPSAIRARKGGEPIVCLTAYTTPTARLMDAEVDLILVGDSLGMVIYGMSSTVGVTLDMMVAHGQAVMRGSAHACVVVDLPFGTYEESPAQAFRSAARVMSETGCAAVKLEGGVEMAETIRFLTRRGVPVLGHVGLTPQSINALGGYGVRGRRRRGRHVPRLPPEVRQALRNAGRCLCRGGARLRGRRARPPLPRP